MELYTHLLHIHHFESDEEPACNICHRDVEMRDIDDWIYILDFEPSHKNFLFHQGLQPSHCILFFQMLLLQFQ
jgi:hypothetical protein